MTDEKEIADFISASNEAIDGKFIVAEKRISSLLRTIAASDRLIEIFKTVTRNYDFRTEFGRACDKVGARGKLVMPSTPAAFLAFAFCLLMEIDSGKRSLRKLVDEFYRAPNANEQYSLFAKAVLVPVPRRNRIRLLQRRGRNFDRRSGERKRARISSRNERGGKPIGRGTEPQTGVLRAYARTRTRSYGRPRRILLSATDRNKIFDPRSSRNFERINSSF